MRERSPLSGDVAAGPAAKAAAVPAQAGEASNVWAQEVSDVAPDPSIRFGKLPNGMRYALKRNATPTGQASLRLRFDAGSLDETDEQRGLAHYLEHMAFNGSTAIPEGELVKLLERRGLAFGADTNASTSWTETIYKLDLPQTDDATVADALKVLREQASNLLLETAAIDRERGVVLSEERSRDTPPYRVFMQRLGFFLQGQRPPSRSPIGTVATLNAADQARIRSFYQAWYRPERATLVAVGDFDLDAMEARIKTGFADWTAGGPALAEPPLGAVAKRGTEAKVVVEPGGSTALQIGWVQAADLSPDTAAKRRRDIVEAVGLAVLNRRLERIARADAAPFISAGGYKGDEFHAAEVTTLAVTAKPDGWQAALTAAEAEQRRYVQYGAQQTEVDREVAEYRAALTAQAAGAATRRTPALAEDITGSLDDRRVVTDPAQDLAAFEAAVKGLTAEQATAAARAAFQGSGPLIFLSSPTAVVGGDAGLLAAWRDAAAQPVAAPAAVAAKDWPYTSFGAASAVVERREVADLDASFIRFANGVRLTVKPTRFRDDQVLVSVHLGNGRLDLPRDQVTPAWAVGAFTAGGLGRLTEDELQATLASKVVGVNLEVEDEALELTGATRPEDLETQLQLLAAYVEDPAFRPEAFARLKSYGATLLDQFEATPRGVRGRDLPALLHGGDARWAFPDRAQIAAGTSQQFRDLLAPRLREGPVEVVVVGDITVEKAVEAVGLTFGALKSRPEVAPRAGGDRVAFAAPTTVSRTHKGRADQALAYVAWPTADFVSDPQRARALRVLSLILELRLIDEVREKQGVTYSPGVGFESSFTYPGYGYLSAEVEAPPEKLAAFYADVDRIAAELAAAPPSEDELQRARQPRVELLTKARQTNEYWLGQLAGAQTDPRRLEAIRAAISGLQRVRASDVQAVAKAYLQPGRAFRFTVLPEKR